MLFPKLTILTQTLSFQLVPLFSIHYSGTSLLEMVFIIFFFFFFFTIFYYIYYFFFYKKKKKKSNINFMKKNVLYIIIIIIFIEYRNKTLTKIFKSPKKGCYFLAFVIFTLGIVRDLL